MLMQIDPAGLDLENVPEGYAVDYVYMPKIGRPRMVHRTLPFEFWAEAFEAASKRTFCYRPFALPILFKVPPVKLVDPPHRCT